MHNNPTLCEYCKSRIYETVQIHLNHTIVAVSCCDRAIEEAYFVLMEPIAPGKTPEA